VGYFVKKLMVSSTKDLAETLTVLTFTLQPINFELRN